ncbi:membrane integrity-associated transporter subunit PqiC [Halopseudomonas pelagia]|uniref:Membrane integrity-associated transporter subunit PqiC n=1 Tax=Halopseudomonas pelagia TaxID=553151 RepID=A0AA91U2H7_9GAMM|nr:PqiC family protein [Halopseudomonas pelagia]PCC99220.1 hypothetical protein CO192_11610 [Halopseudomonas pelagia]QFY56453.1 membrane integrity-associated transporter subunit PqiC [Halopseudomonas pelagia]
MTLRQLLPKSLLHVGCLLMLSACSSTPMQYHTLIPTQPTTVSAQTPAHFQLQLMPVRIPVQIDQPSLVIRESDGQLTLLENALWASPPADEFHDALAFELENRLGVRDLAGLPGNPGEPVLSVRTDVRRFDSLPGRHAALDVVWNIELSNIPSQHRSLTCASLIIEPTDLELSNLVLAHQLAIGKLADDISGTARRWFASGVAGCP